MTLYITGFIVALILALLVIAWIAYCMFVKEKHKSEFYHRNISDLQRRNEILEQVEETTPEKKEIGVGILVLPSRHKNNLKMNNDNNFNMINLKRDLIIQKVLYQSQCLALTT